MKRLLLFLTGIAALNLSAQNKMHQNITAYPLEVEYAQSHFEPVFSESDNSWVKSNLQTVDSYIREVHNSVQNSVRFIPVDTTFSIAGKHYRFLQHINDVEVYMSGIKINTDNQGNITSVFSRIFEESSIAQSAFPTDQLVHSFADSFHHMQGYAHRSVYLWNGSQLIPASVVWVEYGQHQKFEYVIDENAQVLYSRDLNMYHNDSEGAGSNSDSIVTALVFDPDPLTTANSGYTPPYIDNNDQDVAALNAERQSVTFKAGYNNGTYSLNGPIVSVQDFSAPSTPTFSTTSNNWTYTRSQDEFEEIMVYYHIDQYVRYLRGLGFNQFMNYVIPVDAHALQGSDNSMFSSNSGGTGSLFFGDGGVDDAEDADVILHELGHAMSHFASQSNVGTERRSLDEALGDYFAVSYSASVSSFRSTDVFTWDGHNEYWNGRLCVSSKCYDNITISSSIYQHTDIICASLNEIAIAIGRQEADRILLESMYSYSTNMSFKDAARLFVQADSLLNGGQNFFDIASIFDSYCLYDGPISVREYGVLENINVLNSQNFSAGQDVTFVFNKSFSGDVVVTNGMGQTISSEIINAETTEYSLSGAQWVSGMYFVTFRNGSQIKTFKLIR